MWFDSHHFGSFCWLQNGASKRLDVFSVFVVAGALRALCIVAGRRSKNHVLIRGAFFITGRDYLPTKFVARLPGFRMARKGTEDL